MTVPTDKDKTPEWHYLKDSQTVLSLSVAQIRSILNDGGASIYELTNSFVQLASTFNDLIEHKTDIDHTDLAKIKSQIEQGIVSFQFYDRISQRLHHVSNSLEQMGAIIDEKKQYTDPDQWLALQKNIKDKYTMESERILYSNILAGKTVDEALDLITASNDSSVENDIELF